MKFEINNNKVTVLGFANAGWNNLINYCTKKGKEVYTSSKTPLEPHQEHLLSIYTRYHTKDILDSKPSKRKEPESVSQAITVVYELLLSIQHPETRKNLIEKICKIYLSMDDAKRILDEIENSGTPNEKAIEELLKLTEYSDLEIYTQNKITTDIDLTGYYLTRSISSYIDEIFSTESDELKSNLKEWCNHANLEPEDNQAQMALAQSKAVVVDTVQMNLILLSQGEPLIPIYIASSSENFTPNWEKATNKEGNYYTLAEIRMIYKLMEELGDPLITKILKETTIFLHKNGDDFTKTYFPWDLQPEQWKNRKRTRNKPAYYNRNEDDLQPWLKELLELSRETANSLDVDIMLSPRSPSPR